MRVECPTCHRFYDDAIRWTICPHNILEAGPHEPRGTPNGYCAEHDLYFCQFDHKEREMSLHPGWKDSAAKEAEIVKSSFMHPLMPLYTCHKDVRGLKIVTLQKLDDEQQTVIMHFAEGEQFSRQVSTINRPKPEEGWYFVDYGDYYSFSPAEKFEAGYTLKV